MKLKNGIKAAKCQFAPKYSENQMQRAKTNCRKLYRKSIDKILVIGD
jgi:hypothetical protein